MVENDRTRVTEPSWQQLSTRTEDLYDQLNISLLDVPLLRGGVFDLVQNDHVVEPGNLSNGLLDK